MPTVQHPITSLLAGGYRLIPIKPGEKRPALKTWQNAELDAAALARWPGHGVGVICGRGEHPICALDIDCKVPEVVDAFRDWCVRHLGMAPERVGDAPKTLLVYRATAPGWAKVTGPYLEDLAGNRHRLEALGAGQQFVAYHVHPDTGRPYEWTDILGGLEAVPAAQLPVITADQVAQAMAAFVEIAEAAGLDKVHGKGSSTAGPRTAAGSDDPIDTFETPVGLSLERLRDLLASVTPDEYDEWIRVGQALHHETEGDDEGLALWDEWSRGSDKYRDREDLERRWAGFGRHGRAPLTARWLLKQAKDAREEAEALERTAASDQFERITAELRQLPAPEIGACWASRAQGLPEHYVDDLIEEVSRLTRRGRRSLNREYQEHRRALAEERRRNRTREMAAGREIIEWEPQNSMQIAERVENIILERRPPEDYAQFSGGLAQVRSGLTPHAHYVDDTGRNPPEVVRIDAHSEVTIRAAVESVVVLVSGGKPISVPPQVVKNLLANQTRKAPLIAGLSTHPLVRHDGSIAGDTKGLDTCSGLYFHSGRSGDGIRDSELAPYTQTQAVDALGRIRVEFLRGFEFITPLDEAVALAALVTGVQRPVLDMAPGFAILAPMQGSGKTTFARRLHLVLTGREMPVSPFPERDEAEVGKRLLAMLLGAPAMVCFDNIADGAAFKSNTVAAAMTSPFFRQRILGATVEAEAPTNVLFTLTGNNITLGKDELTRWMPCRLAPPLGAAKRFDQPDVVAHARRHRAWIIRDVVGIVSGYIHAGAPPQQGLAVRFSAWDRMVRSPLIWAGVTDVAEVFSANIANSDEIQSRAGFLSALQRRFGNNPFTAAEVVASSSVDWVDNDSDVPPLASALAAAGARDPGSPRSVSSLLSACCGVPMQEPGASAPTHLVRKHLRTGVLGYSFEAAPAGNPTP